MTQSPNVAAVAIVIIANWIICHLAPDWRLDPEVQTAFQGLITFAGGMFVRGK